MLSIFPSLFSWSEISPFLIRIVLGVILIPWAWRRLATKGSDTKSKVVGVVDAILGILFVIGLWTQIAAIVLGLDMLRRIIKKSINKEFLTDGVNYYLILLVLSISLLVTGAGWWAFDMAL